MRRRAVGNDLRPGSVAAAPAPAVGRALLRCATARAILASCPSVPCAPATIGWAPLRNSMPWPTPYAGPHEVATIYLGLSPRLDLLGDADVRRTREMFRKRLDRAGFKGAIVAGGIEVAWQEHWQRWRLHAQVLAMGVDPNAWQQLEAALRQSGTGDPVRVLPLRNPDEQLSYCVKFVTYQQPGRRRFGLPPDRLVELAAWWSQYRFSEDFFFAMRLAVAAGAWSSISSRSTLPCVRRLRPGQLAALE